MMCREPGCNTASMPRVSHCVKHFANTVRAEKKQPTKREPLPRSLRDEFALSFINGMAAFSGGLTEDDISDAYRVADKALLEREK